MEFLKELVKGYIDEAQVDEFIDKFNKEVPKHLMPKAKFNEVNDELKLSKQQIAENKATLETLSAKADSVEGYEKQIKDAQEKYKELETQMEGEISKITKKNLLKDSLTNSGMPKSIVDLYIKSANLDEVELVEGKVNPSYIDALKTNQSDLFVTEETDSVVKDQNKDNPTPDVSMSAFAKGMGIQL